MVETKKLLITGKAVVLRDKTMEDAPDDFRWESDPELARLDATSPVSCTFARYLADYAEELRNPFTTSCRFGVDTPEGKHIGNCAYYNISERHSETEFGIMIGDRDYWNKGYGVDIITTLLDHIFENTRMKRVYLKTLADNYRAQRCFRKSGFKPYVRLVRDGHDFLFMEIFRREWLMARTEARKTDSEHAPTE
jgi:RimJ/RimL family protein N-acetyltransferase